MIGDFAPTLSVIVVCATAAWAWRAWLTHRREVVGASIADVHADISRLRASLDKTQHDLTALCAIVDEQQKKVRDMHNRMTVRGR